MKIKITKHVKVSYTADAVEIPGSPPVGRANTPELAVAILMQQLSIRQAPMPLNADDMEIVYENDEAES